MCATRATKHWRFPISTGKLVDVVVVSYNSARQLRRCVEALSHDQAIEVIVVDNASQDNSVSAVSDLRVKVIALQRNVGFGGGCNVGWHAGDAEYVLFLNPDARISPTDVSALAHILDREDGGAVAPRIVDEGGTLEWSLRRFPTVRSIFGQAFFAHRLLPKASWVDEVIRDPQRYDRQSPCEWASGACLMVRRDLLDRIGGFDQRFFMYCEDVDLCRRLWNLGSAVLYTPSITCAHSGGASAPRWQLTQTLARSRISYGKKHFGRLHALAYQVGVALNALTHVFAGRDFERRVGHAHALATALRPGRRSKQPASAA